MDPFQVTSGHQPPHPVRAVGTQLLGTTSPPQRVRLKRPQARQLEDLMLRDRGWIEGENGPDMEMLISRYSGRLGVQLTQHHIRAAAQALKIKLHRPYGGRERAADAMRETQSYRKAAFVELCRWVIATGTTLGQPIGPEIQAYLNHLATKGDKLV